MSVLINMEMPENCVGCPLAKNYGMCAITKKTFNWGNPNRLSDCPLIEILPHGRLIDADAYHKEIRERYQSAKEWYNEAEDDEIIGRAEATMITFTECSLTLQNMPTIIEGEDKT